MVIDFSDRLVVFFFRLSGSLLSFPTSSCLFYASKHWPWMVPWMALPTSLHPTGKDWRAVNVGLMVELKSSFLMELALELCSLWDLITNSIIIAIVMPCWFALSTLAPPSSQPLSSFPSWDSWQRKKESKLQMWSKVVQDWHSLFIQKWSTNCILHCFGLSSFLPCFWSLELTLNFAVLNPWSLDWWTTGQKL